MKSFLSKLPIEEAIPELFDSFNSSKNVILSAPPGAGKTTRVPLTLLETNWMSDKKIIMLEPRRLAARHAAEYMASQLDEKVGQTIGYRIRGEAIVGKKTRIEVVTEGILTRLLQHDPALPGVALIIFDEFHERSIHADLGLALTLDVQEHLRSDLCILIMSATLDGASIAHLFDHPRIVESKGIGFPVTTQYTRFTSEKSLEARITDTILRSIAEHEGDILVFLPGRREIRRIESLLWEKHIPEDISIHALYGEASYQQQLAALTPAPLGKRKVILSTSIAETSITIEGIRIVIDSGLARTSKFDVRRGMSGLITITVSKAIADQRRGRAGRLQSGVCYRMWTEQEHKSLPDYPQPEIKITDLAPLALDFALWGTPNGEHLRFLDSPPTPHLVQAQSLLKDLGAIDHSGKLTSHGRAMADLPLHPRLSHMILRGTELGLGSLACDVAALLDERDPLASTKDNDIDLSSRLHFLHSRAQRGEERVRERILAQSKRLKLLTNPQKEKKHIDEQDAGILLALAYPERIGRRREKNYQYQLTSGMTASLPHGSLLSREEFLSFGEVDGLGTEVKAYLASPVSQKQIEKVFADSLIMEEEIRWDADKQSVVARYATRLNALILSERHIEPRGEKVIPALFDGIRQMGLDCLPWDNETRSIQQRSEWIRKRLNPQEWPDFSSITLLKNLEEWITPFLQNVWRRQQLQNIDLHGAFRARFTIQQWHELERLSPSHLKLPSGSRAAIDYSSGDQPILAVKLQELFGQTDTPKICNGSVSILVHLLSPAHRPLAVTQDLRSFWMNTYPEIRIQMKARYPKHFWPENPLKAKPTNKTIRRK